MSSKFCQLSEVSQERGDPCKLQLKWSQMPIAWDIQAIWAVQAMAAYRAAARRFPGLHQPLLGIGMEYARMNNLNLALQCLQNAHDLAPTCAWPAQPMLMAWLPAVLCVRPRIQSGQGHTF